MNPIEASKAQQQAEFCGILGNSRRIEILWALGERELTVSDISKVIGSSMQNTSQHLRLMKNKGVLLSRREGREIYYSIKDTPFSRNCPVISNK